MVSFSRRYRLKRKTSIQQGEVLQYGIERSHSGIYCQDNFMILMIQVKCIFFEVLFLMRIML